MCNNKKSFTLIKNTESQNCIKQINVIYHQIKQPVEDRKLEIEWILSCLMLANGFIKALSVGFFKRYQEKWGRVR